jgi:NADPH-dependent 2,4-dienoyl-CoA reductase/sulfur reductase-like enzyme
VPARPRVDPAVDPRSFVICGAGAAGAAAALALRERGFRGGIVLLGEDPRPPYDRTLLSKELMQGGKLPGPLALRPEAFWRAHGIELRLGARIVRLDAREQPVQLADGTVHDDDQALLATGGAPRRLDVAGAALPGVFTLRSHGDMEAVVAAAGHAGRVIVVGGSFIALECAWSLRERGLEVALVAPEKVLLGALFGPRVGARLAAIQRALGTELHLGAAIERFEGGERLAGLRLRDGRRVAGEVVLLGVGVRPATGFVRGVALDEDGGVSVDAHLQAAPNLYAAGDVARFPMALTGERVRIEHWRLACQQGALAGRNMAGGSEPWSGVPFFWSAQQIALYYVGHASGFDEIVYDGAPEEGPFIAYYLRGDRLSAALGVERNAEMAALEELMRRQRLPAGAAVRTGSFRALEALAEL